MRLESNNTDLLVQAVMSQRPIADGCSLTLSSVKPDMLGKFYREFLENSRSRSCLMVQLIKQSLIYCLILLVA